MPRQRPGQSEQTVQTPENFLDAVKLRLGIFAFGLDLAATPENAVAKRYFTEQDDAFLQLSWKAPGKQWSWLNPPFGSIGPWAARCVEDRDRQGARIALLVPASTGAEWWWQSVHRKGLILLLAPRLKFVGHTDYYPKDLVLVLYAPDIRPGYRPWRWRA